MGKSLWCVSFFVGYSMMCLNLEAPTQQKLYAVSSAEMF